METEMGSFFAAKVFINRTLQVVMDLPVADIHDSKDHLRFRAVCDERITLPLKVLRHFPEIYNTLSTSLGLNKVSTKGVQDLSRIGAEALGL